jgi:hypothetical protein
MYNRIPDNVIGSLATISASSSSVVWMIMAIVLLLVVS